MGLRDLVNNVFRRNDAPVASTTISTREPAPANAAPTTLAHKFAAETDRRKIIEACRMMYKVDPRIKKMHRQLARDIIKGGFVVRTSNQVALQEAQALISRLNLNKRIDDYVRLSARDGDSFLQVEINDAFDVVGISRKPTLA